MMDNPPRKKYRDTLGQSAEVARHPPILLRESMPVSVSYGARGQSAFSRPQQVMPPNLKEPAVAPPASVLSSSVAGSQYPLRKKWHDPPTEVASTMTLNERRDILAEQLNKLTEALKRFDEDVKNRKGNKEETVQERMRGFSHEPGAQLENNMGRYISSRHSKPEPPAYVFRSGGHVLRTCTGGGSSSESSSERSVCNKIPAVNNRKARAEPVRPELRMVPPHLRHISGIEEKYKAAASQAPGPQNIIPQPRSSAVKNDTTTADLRKNPDMLAPAGDAGINNTSLPMKRAALPSHLSIFRNITDPTKIIHISETPPAPHRNRIARNSESDKTSPTPRKGHHGLHTTHDSPGSEIERELAQSSSSWVKPPPPATSMEVRVLNTAGDSTDQSQLETKFGGIGAGTIPAEPDVHVALSTGEPISTSKYALPEGHVKPWVRNQGRPLRVRRPPEEFIVRSMIPPSYKDSALPPRERADAFEKRLAEVEKMSGKNGRYPGEKGRFVGRRLMGPEGHNARRIEYHGNTTRRVQRGFSNSAPNINSPDQTVHLNPHHDIHHPRRQLLITSGGEIGESMAFKDSDIPTNMVTERKIILLEKLPQKVSVKDILRSLGNTGRIIFVRIKEDPFSGRYAIIKFYREETAARLASRDILAVPLDLHIVLSLCITHLPGETFPINQVDPLEENGSRILWIGPCPLDYFPSAYIESCGGDGVFKENMVGYIHDTVKALCSEHYPEFLDVAIDQAGSDLMKATLHFASIKAADALRTALRELATFKQVSVDFGPDPCVGPEECKILGIPELRRTESIEIKTWQEKEHEIEMDSHRRMMEEEIQAHFKKTDENGLEKAPGHMDLDRLAVPVLKENFDRGRRLGRRHAEYTEKHGRHQVVGDLNENRRPLPRLVKEGGVRG